MALFRRLADSFTDKKSTQADDDRDQVIRETKKKSRVMNDNVWIKSKPEETQQIPADVNYGKSVLKPVKSEENLNSDPSTTSSSRPTKADTLDGRKRDTGSTSELSKTQRASTLDRPKSSEPAHGHHEKVVLSRYRSEEILNRDTGSTDISSPTSKYSSLDRRSRTSSYKGDDVPTMTIITSEPKSESPTSKGLQSRPSPDGQVTTQEKSPTKPILKWGSQKDESPETRYEPKTSTLERNKPKTPTKTESESLIDLTPPPERKSKGSNFLSNFGSKSLIDLSLTPEKTNTKSPVTTPTTPVRTSSLIELSPSMPAKSKRSNTEWDKPSQHTSTSSKSTFNPKNSSEDWDELNSSPTTSTKSSFNSRNPSNNEDWDNTNTTTSTKTYDPKSRSSRKGGNWEITSPTTTTITKSSPDSILKSTRSSTEYAQPKDEPSDYKSPTSYNKSSKTFSSNSRNDQNPDTEPEPYNSRSSYKENSLPDKKIAQADETPSYRSSSYTPQKDRNSSSSLSDGKSPAKVITLTTAITSAEKRSADKNQCSHCYKPIINGAKMILAELNINCHAACLKCQICNATLENLSAGDSFWVHHRTVHCEPCYDNIKVQRSY
ncbi:sciellin isoform X2 [Scyliorhinus canicula]|uniref:sciellin isoform X2 n=1 Tax=Scyliorhinus canicula TaxID=7830 RepID=UPI0018F53221|nr:sciellin isoform X2 [Scyliorhinus canicula]